MKKKGFTLIELLAVIVILAIIALIAIPLIGNVIEKSKIGALENSVSGLVESANMYYANQSIKGEQATETIFDFANGEQTSSQKLEYKGKVYNGKLILHANGEVAVCIDDKEHYAYKNKDTDEIVSGIGTCLYDGTTGDFSSNSSINDLRGKTVVANSITESNDGLSAIITIPEEGHYDGTSQISVPIETIKNNIDSLKILENCNVAYSQVASNTINYYSNHNQTLYATNTYTTTASNVLIYTSRPQTVVSNNQGLNFSSSSGTVIDKGNGIYVISNINGSATITSSAYATGDNASTNGTFSNLLIVVEF